MKPILLATDGSLSAEAATREAIDLARAFGAPLIVVSVAQTVLPAFGAYYGYTELAAELSKSEAEHVAQTLATVRARASAVGVECETVALEGSPAGAEICRFAQEQSPRLVVVGAHGWGRLGRILHGSVSTHVLHHAPCPVLVVLGETLDADAITSMNGTAGTAVAGDSMRG
jgi:nucleotide-binding universal stress UspA family protein